MHLKCIIAILLLVLTGVGQKSAAQQKGKATFYAKRLNSTPPWQIAIDCNIVILGDSNTAIGGDDCSKSVGWNKWFRDMLSPASCRSYARSGEAVHKEIPEKHDETLRTGKPHRLSLQLAGSLSAWKG
ncbi:MAG: hypothetical protein J6V87_04040 [Prevotella sp.]|nr:hypothetical protein [Prevotella sp.]